MQHKYSFRILLFIFCLIALYFTACDKPDDLSNLNTNYHYTGSFSLPVGESTFGIENLYNVPLYDSIELDTAILRQLPQLEFREVIDFSLQQSRNSISYIKSAMLRLKVRNDFPDFATIQAYFVTSHYQYDSLINDDNIVPIANLDDNGFVVSQGEWTKDIELDKEDIELFKIVDGLLLVLTFNNKGIDPNKYLYYDSLKIYAKAAIRIDFDFQTDSVKTISPF